MRFGKPVVCLKCGHVSIPLIKRLYIYCPHCGNFYNGDGNIHDGHPMLVDTWITSREPINAPIQCHYPNFSVMFNYDIQTHTWSKICKEYESKKITIAMPIHDEIEITVEKKNDTSDRSSRWTSWLW